MSYAEDHYPFAPFPEPVEPPDTESGGFICMRFDANWYPYVLGCLTTLVRRQTWATDQDAAVAGAERLIADVMQDEGCDVITDIRLVGCVLQELKDGEWVDI